MNIIVASKIKALRKNKNMSQEEMADCLEISQSAYARMESGKSHTWAIHILKISKIFAIAPEELLKVDVKKTDILYINNKDQLSDTIIEQYEDRIQELKKIIKDLKKNKKPLKS